MTITEHRNLLMPALKELCRNFRIEVIIPLCYRKVGMTKDTMTKLGYDFLNPDTLDELDYYSTNIERVASKNVKWINDRPVVKSNLGIFRKNYAAIKELSKQCSYVRYSEKDCDSIIVLEDICDYTDFVVVNKYFEQGYDIQGVFLQRDTHHYTIKLCQPKKVNNKRSCAIMPLDYYDMTSKGDIKGNFTSMTDVLMVKLLAEAKNMQWDLLCVLKHDKVFPMLVEFEEVAVVSPIVEKKKKEKIRPISDHRRNDFVCPDKAPEFVTF